MRNLFQHNRFEDREFNNLYSELSDINESQAKLAKNAVWHNGTGEPDKALGSNGDYYIDRGSNDIYLKENGEWL